MSQPRREAPVRKSSANSGGASVGIAGSSAAADPASGFGGFGGVGPNGFGGGGIGFGLSGSGGGSVGGENSADTMDYTALSQVLREIDGHSFADDDRKFECVQSVWGTVWDSVADHIVESHRDALAVPYTVENLGAEILECFTMISLRPDCGSVVVFNSNTDRGDASAAARSSQHLVSEFGTTQLVPNVVPNRKPASVLNQEHNPHLRPTIWSFSDDEPDPSPIDVWASGVVPMRPPGGATLSGDGYNDLGAGYGGPRVGFGADASDRKKSQMNQDNSAILAAMRRQSIPLDPGGTFARMRTDSISSSFRMVKTSSFRSPAVAISEQDKREREFIDDMKKELKGSPNYVYDRDGRVIVLKQFKPEALPAQTINTRISIRDPNSSQAPDKRTGGRARMSPPGGGGDSGSPVRPTRTHGGGRHNRGGGGPGGTLDVDDIIVRSNAAGKVDLVHSTQVNLSDHLVLQHGVTFKEGKNKKSGPARVSDDPKAMTIKEFQRSRNDGKLPVTSMKTTEQSAFSGLRQSNSFAGNPIDKNAKRPSSASGKGSSGSSSEAAKQRDQSASSRPNVSKIQLGSLQREPSASSVDGGDPDMVAHRRTPSASVNIPLSPSQRKGFPRVRPLSSSMSFTTSQSTFEEVAAAQPDSLPKSPRLPPPLYPDTMGHGFDRMFSGARDSKSNGSGGTSPRGVDGRGSKVSFQHGGSSMSRARASPSYAGSAEELNSGVDGSFSPRDGYPRNFPTTKKSDSVTKTPLGQRLLQ